MTKNYYFFLKHFIFTALFISLILFSANQYHSYRKKILLEKKLKPFLLIRDKMQQLFRKHNYEECLKEYFCISYADPEMEKTPQFQKILKEILHIRERSKIRIEFSQMPFSLIPIPEIIWKEGQKEATVFIHGKPFRINEEISIGLKGITKDLPTGMKIVAIHHNEIFISYKEEIFCIPNQLKNKLDGFHKCTKECD